MNFIKYIPFILVGISFLVAAYFIFTRDHLLKFVVASMCTDGKPDSKKMSGFVMVVSLVAAFFIAIYYADKHLAPEFFVYIIAGLIASFYGIREVGRFVNNKYGTPAEQPEPQAGIPVVQPNAAYNAQDAAKKPNDEIG